MALTKGLSGAIMGQIRCRGLNGLREETEPEHGAVSQNKEPGGGQRKSCLAPSTRDPLETPQSRLFHDYL